MEPLNNSLCSVPTRCISRHLPLVKMISAQNSHYLSAFLLLFLKKGRLPPVSGYGEFSPGHGKRIQIGTSEHGVQSVLVFLQTTIHGFPVAELTLDDPEQCAAQMNMFRMVCGAHDGEDIPYELIHTPEK